MYFFQLRDLKKGKYRYKRRGVFPLNFEVLSKILTQLLQRKYSMVPKTNVQYFLNFSCFDYIFLTEITPEG